MLLKFESSLDQAWQDVQHELHRGALDRKHPFRFVTISTYGHKGVQARWVVLRKLSPELHFFLYSDMRTQKIEDLQAHPQAQLLFYHPRKQIQVRCNVDLLLHHQNEVSKNHWKDVREMGARSYTPVLQPGSPIHTPQEAHRWSASMNDRNFAVIECIPNEIDALQLNKSEHLRARFRKKDHDWEKTWVAP